MKRKTGILFTGLLVILTSTGKISRAQTSDQMLTMVKGMIEQFRDFAAEDFETDEVIDEGAVIVPGIKFNDKSIYTEALKDPSGLFELTDFQNGYALIDDNEIPTNSLTLVFSYLGIPGFQNLNAWFDLETVEDKDGKNLLLSEKELQKYMDYGIIDDGFNFPIPGEFSETIWMNREPQYGEVLSITGNIGLEYPSDYSMLSFTKEDKNKSGMIGNTEITFLEIDRNLLTCLFKGDRRDIEGLRVILLNKDGKSFSSVSSMAIDARYYNPETGELKEYTDDDLRSEIENFDLSDMQVEQVKKTKVYGNIDKVIFMKVNSVEYMDVDFAIKIGFEF